jgi:hypothetical protein
MPASLGRDPTTAAVEGVSRAALSHATEESNLGTGVTGEARCRPRNRSRCGESLPRTLSGWRAVNGSDKRHARSVYIGAGPSLAPSAGAGGADAHRITPKPRLGFDCPGEGQCRRSSNFANVRLDRFSTPSPTAQPGMRCGLKR